MAPRTQFKANQVSGFNADYYLGKNPDVGSTFNDWAGQQPMHYKMHQSSDEDLKVLTMVLMVTSGNTMV